MNDLQAGKFLPDAAVLLTNDKSPEQNPSQKKWRSMQSQNYKFINK